MGLGGRFLSIWFYVYILGSASVTRALWMLCQVLYTVRPLLHVWLRNRWQSDVDPGESVISSDWFGNSTSGLRASTAFRFLRMLLENVFSTAFRHGSEGRGHPSDGTSAQTMDTAEQFGARGSDGAGMTSDAVAPSPPNRRNETFDNMQASALALSMPSPSQPLASTAPSQYAHIPRTNSYSAESAQALALVISFVSVHLGVLPSITWRSVLEC